MDNGRTDRPTLEIIAYLALRGGAAITYTTTVIQVTDYAIL